MGRVVNIVVARTEDNYATGLGHPYHFAILLLGLIPEHMAAHRDIDEMVREGDVRDETVYRIADRTDMNDPCYRTASDQSD